MIHSMVSLLILVALAFWLDDSADTKSRNDATARRHGGKHDDA